MLEHVTVPVTNFEKAKRFYAAALKPLGYKLQHDYPPEAAGFYDGRSTDFWIGKKKSNVTIHVAFRAKSRKQVQEFYKAALKNGGKNNGKPGRRKGYGYAAFAFDPSGNNIEAVYFERGDK